MKKIIVIVFVLNLFGVLLAKAIKNDPSYEKFFGYTDKRFYSGDSSLCQQALRSVLAYPGINYNLPEFHGVSVPRPQYSSTSGLIPGTDFEQLMIHALPPSSQSNNMYVQITSQPPGDDDPRGYEKRLEDSILTSGGNLSPAEVMMMALKTTNGNYPMAVLTAHNLFKNITYQGRSAATKLSGAVKRGTNYTFPVEYGEFASKLINLRSKPGDKMGIWYHLFVPLTIDAWTGDPHQGTEAIEEENAVRELGAVPGVRKVVNMGSPVDKEKEASDYCFDKAARSIWMSKQKQSTGTADTGTKQITRFDDPTIGGVMLDNCRVWEHECGQPAADAYCQMKGFARATDFQIESYSPTKVIDGGRICTFENHFGVCGRLKFVTCSPK